LNPYGSNPASTSRETAHDIIVQSGLDSTDEATPSNVLEEGGQPGPTPLPVLVAELAVLARTLPREAWGGLARASIAGAR
jgi:hypothetical protein